jgi:uncharacterized protein
MLLAALGRGPPARPTTPGAPLSIPPMEQAEEPRRDRLPARLLRRYVALCARRAPLIVLAAAALTAVSIHLASGLVIDTRLEALLPDDARSVLALEEAQARVPVRSPLQLLVKSDDPALNRVLTDRLVEALRGWPETRWAVTARDPRGLWERRLLFAPAADLERWATSVEDRLAWERCARVPGCVNFDDAPPLPTEAEVRDRLASVPELASLSRYFGTSSGVAEGGDTEAASEPPDGRLCSEDGTICAVDASMSVSARDLGVATRILERAEALLDEVRPSDAPPSLEMAVSGPFRNGPVIKRVTEGDLAVVSLVSGLLVLVVLVSLFRGPRPEAVVVVPMLMATAWVLGGLGAFGVELNLISAFTFAILVGIGTDYGLHLATYYGSQRAQGLGPVEAMEDTLRALGTSLVTAAATTAFAFASLMAASFRGFAQMGAVASLGVLACLVSYLLLVPAIVLAADRILPEKGSWNRVFRARREPGPPRYPRLRLWLGLAIAIALGVLGMQVQVETDFSNLRADGVAHGLPTGDAIHGTNGVGVQIIGDGAAEVARATWEVHDAVREDLVGEDGALALTAETFLPRDQDARLAAIVRLREAIDDASRLGSDADRERLESMRPLVDIDGPIAADDLPPWISDWLVDAEGRLGSLGLVFVRLRGTDAVAMEGLARVLDRVAVAHPSTVVASDAAILGEVLPGLFRDGPVMVGLSLFGLCFAVWGFGRKLVRVGWVLAPLLLGTAMTAGLMVIFDLKLNLYNLLILPVAFGIGVDGAVYTIYAHEDVASGAADHVRMAENGRALIGATLTTVTGFGSLALSHHLGIVSIGFLGALAIFVTMFTNLVWLPALLEVVERRRRAAGRKSGGISESARPSST